jgi:hypothetical protein
MLFLWLLFRRLPRTLRLLVLAVFVIVFIATVVRISNSIHTIQGGQTNVHTRSTSR